MIQSPTDPAAEEFDMLFYRYGPVWQRSFSTRPENLARDIRYIREQHGLFTPILIIHHPPHYPMPATAYSDLGLERYITELKELRPGP
jgi:hypothetical protein